MNLRARRKRDEQEGEGDTAVPVTGTGSDAGTGSGTGAGSGTGTGSGTGSGTGADTGIETGTGTGADTGPGTGAASAPESRTRPRRPRGATTLLLVAAAVLGLGGGTAYGYHVQADRHPKPLPPLAQSGLSYPKKTLPADAKGSRPPLEENQDHQLVYRGGLDRLLMPLPKGWWQQEEGERTYGSAFLRSGDLLRYELEGNGDGRTLEEDLVAGFSRIAGDDWSGPGRLSATIRLADFAPGSNAEARAAVKKSLNAVKLNEGFGDLRIRSGPPGTHVFFWKAPTRAGAAPQWGGWVIGSRGSVRLDMTFWDDKPLDQELVLGLAKKQWERL